MRVVIEHGRKRIIRSMQRDWRSWGFDPGSPWRATFPGRTSRGPAPDRRQCQRQAVHEPRRHPPRRSLLAGPPLRWWWAEVTSFTAMARRAINVSGRSINSPRRGVSFSAACARTDGVQEVVDRLQPLGAWKWPWRGSTRYSQKRREARSTRVRLRKLATRRLVRSASTTPSIRTSWSAGELERRVQ